MKTLYIAGQYFLNHHLEDQELRRQIKALGEAGYECIYGHARQGLKTPYFSEAWWRAIQIIVDECRANGMEFAIWDEDYFPSAVAGDRIIWNYPELTAQALDFTIVEVAGDDHLVEVKLKSGALLRCYALPKTESGFGSPIDITSYCGTVRRHWTGRKVCESAYSIDCKVGTPHWRTTMNDKTFALMWQPEDEREYVIVAIQVTFPEGRHNTDILNPETTRKFIEYTHEEYLKRFGVDTLVKDFHATFMDEPAPAGNFPWTRDFDLEFSGEHGFSLLEYLPHLVLDINEQTPLIRHKYRMTQMRLQCDSYLRQIQDWCHAQRIKSAGHLTRTEFLSYVGHAWPNELRCYKYLDIPCTDPLGAGIGWGDACAYHTGLKVASSAAHIFGKEQAGSDALAVMGNETSLRDLKFALDYQMVLGINYFNIHGLNYSLDGARKDETPPSLFYQHSEWKYMSELIKHTKQTCEALSGGKHVCHIAVLYPSSSFYCGQQPDRTEPSELEQKIHLLSEALLSNQKDFDFVDEITLAELLDSEMPEDWQYIILPYLGYIEKRTTGYLKKFIDAGGKVIVIGKTPQILCESIDCPLEEWNLNPITFFADMTDGLLTSLPGPKLTGAGCNDIFVLQREKAGEVISFLVNRSEKEFIGCLDGHELRIAPKGSVLLKEKDVCCRQLSEDEPVKLSDGWNLEFESNHVPLCNWNVVDEQGNSEVCNLLERQTCLPEAENKVYTSRFLFTGEQIPLTLVLEESSIDGVAKVFLNDVEIKDFKREQVYDCLNITADISFALRCGTTPTENILRIEIEGKSDGLQEMPYLYGNFKCEHRYAHKSLPFLEAVDSVQRLDNLLPWGVLGYGSFSGTGSYVKDLTITQAGAYKLLLGRVEDVAEVFIDGKAVKTIAWPPYECLLGYLAEGTHELRINIANGPGNRDRLAGLPAGLLGPVSVVKQRGNL